MLTRFSTRLQSSLVPALTRLHIFNSHYSTSASANIPFDTQPFPFKRFEPCCPATDVDPSNNGYIPCLKHPMPNVLGRKIDMTDNMIGRADSERHVVMCVGQYGREWERAKVETVVDGSVYATQQLHKQYLRNNRHVDTPPTDKDFLLTVCDRSPSSQCDMMVFPEFVLYPNVDPTRLADSPVAHVLETLWNNPASPTLPTVADATAIKNDQGQDVDAVVLVCTHERRDMRCGKIGPLIVDAFKKSLQERLGDNNKVLVYGTSHFGGHKFAGNVIIHQKGLGGHMYGNVRDCMVDQIVERHLVNGKIIKELWRGLVTPPTLDS
ncbi:Sucrase/ferredoxin-like-domain-containing protein [Chlamydoabsidia padenii]|nr:Sucrase/ferredoxin-like-domain-containing protein [Chlamydoabsidia padenii]